MDNILIHIISLALGIGLLHTEVLLMNIEVPHHKKAAKLVRSLLLERKGIALTIIQMRSGLFDTVARCCLVRQMTPDLHQVIQGPTVLNHIEKTFGVDSHLK